MSCVLLVWSVIGCRLIFGKRYGFWAKSGEEISPDRLVTKNSSREESPSFVNKEQPWAGLSSPFMQYYTSASHRTTHRILLTSTGLLTVFVLETRELKDWVLCEEWNQDLKLRNVCYLCYEVGGKEGGVMRPKGEARGRRKSGLRTLAGSP